MQRSVVLLLGLTLGLAACRDEAPGPVQPDDPVSPALLEGANAVPADFVPEPFDEADFLARFPRLGGDDLLTRTEDLLPDAFFATLLPEASASEAKTAVVDPSPPKGDVLFTFDLTGSMFGAIGAAKTGSVDIMNAVAGVITDVQFGVVSYRDYPGNYTNPPDCEYDLFGWGYMPYGGSSDFPYALNQGITADGSLISAAIAPFTAGGGADGPESYARVMYETYSDGAIGWRTGAKRMVVNFADNIPHDCDLGTGWDPGRDAVIGTSDDLDWEVVLAGMATNNISLIQVHTSSYYFSAWETWAESTGGAAYQLYIASSDDIADDIAAFIEAEVQNIDAFTVEVCGEYPAYAGWLTGVSPAEYTGLTVEETIELDFELTYTVPAGTAPGVYTFEVCAIGDGAEYGRQTVEITVPDEVAIDIKPGSWPNSINLGNGDSNGKSNGAGANIAVALFSSPAFDATAVDPATVTLGDEAAPDTPVSMKNNGTWFAALEDVNGDGLLDVVFHFDRDVLIANGDLTAATTYLSLWGMGPGGLPFTGMDAVRVVPE
jgi:hypothetical protein